MTHQERLEMFRRLETGVVTDAIVQLNLTGRWMKGIFPAGRDMRVFGRAVTAQFTIVTPPEEPIDQFQLIDRCGEGDVLVWNLPHDGNILGENVMHYLQNNGASGVVLEGYVRDINTIREMGVPQFGRGVSIAPVPRNCRATEKNINVPVSCGGVVVAPGDYLFGDADGVVVVAEKDVDRVLCQAEKNMEYEKRMEEALDQKASYQDLQEVFKTKRVYE